jgi:hypothetical protein
MIIFHGVMPGEAYSIVQDQIARVVAKGPSRTKSWFCDRAAIRALERHRRHESPDGCPQHRERREGKAQLRSAEFGFSGIYRRSNCRHAVRRGRRRRDSAAAITGRARRNDGRDCEICTLARADRCNAFGPIAAVPVRSPVGERPNGNGSHSYGTAGKLSYAAKHLRVPLVEWNLLAKNAFLKRDETMEA